MAHAGNKIKVNIDFDISADYVFPIFGVPEPIGSYSIDNDCVYQNDVRNLRCYVKPSEASLNLDDEECIPRDGRLGYSKLDHLLSFIKENYSTVGFNKVGTSQRFLPYDFVLYRGLLAFIGQIPFQQKKMDWTILAARFKGNTYLCRHRSDAQIRGACAAHKQLGLWECNFKKLCTSGTPSADADPRPFDNNEQLDCVFRSRLGEYSLLYGAEVDAVLSISELNDRMFGENLTQLNTCKRPISQTQKEKFVNGTALSWWLQNFLVGIKTIVVGWQSKYGEVEEIEHIPVNSLRKLEPRIWNGNQCFAFIVYFLDAIQNVVKTTDDANTTFEFSYSSETNEITYTTSEATFLTDDYINFVKDECIKLTSNPINVASNSINIAPMIATGFAPMVQQPFSNAAVPQTIYVQEAPVMNMNFMPLPVQTYPTIPDPNLVYVEYLNQPPNTM